MGILLKNKTMDKTKLFWINNRRLKLLLFMLAVLVIILLQ